MYNQKPAMRHTGVKYTYKKSIIYDIIIVYKVILLHTYL